MKRAVALLLLSSAFLFAGCTSHHEIHSDGARALFLLGFLAAANYGDVREDPVPPLAPDRVISEQDCSKPIDFTAGNLRCK